MTAGQMADTAIRLPPEKRVKERGKSDVAARLRRAVKRAEIGGSSPRPISTGQLKRLPALHSQPIKQVLFLRPYPL